MNAPAIANGPSLEWLPDPDIGTALVQAIGRLPQGRFVFVEGAGRSYELSFAQAYTRARQVQAALVRRGCKQGDRIILDARTPADFIPAFWGTLLGGMIGIPMAPSEWNATGRIQFAERLKFVSSRVNGATILTRDEETFHGGGRLLSYDRLLDDPDEVGAVAPPPESPAVLILTSGTTGRSQLVTLGRRALGHRWFPRLPARETTFLSWMPLEHVMGLGLASPSQGLKIHLSSSEFVRRPGTWLDLAAHHRATHAGMTNFGMRLIAEAAGEARQWDLSAFQRVGVGAEAISPAVCSRFTALLEGCGANPGVVAVGYGLSECGPVAGGTRAFDPAALTAETRHLPVDGPTAGHSIRIVDDEGRLCCEGAVGNIEVRGSTMTSGYVNDPAANQQLFTADGWLRTGDLGFLHGGCLTVVGRAKETLIVNARKYAIPELESVLEKIPGLAAVHVFPLEGLNGLQQPAVAYCAAAPSAELESAIRTALVRHFGFGACGCFHIAAEDVPRTATGKLQRSRLTARFSAFAKPSDTVLTPATALQRVAFILARSLNGTLPGADDDFFQMGGDSLGALTASMAIESEFGIAMPPALFGTHATPRAIMRHIESHVAGDSRVAAVPVKLPGEGGKVLFVAPGLLGGNGFALNFSRAGFDRHGVWTFHLRDPSDRSRRMRSIEELAEECVAVMLRIQPDGPFHLLGHSFGGLVAYAMAHSLRKRGHEVATLALVDTLAPVYERHFGAASRPLPQYLSRHHSQIAANYIAPLTEVRVSYFRATHSAHISPGDRPGGWDYLAAGGVDVYDMPGDHHSIVRGSCGEAVARATRAIMEGSAGVEHVPPCDVAPEVRSHLREALIACRQGLASREISQLQLMVSKNSQFPYWANRRLAQACLERGMIEEGVRGYRAALEKDPWPLGSRSALIGHFNAARLFELSEESLSYAAAAAVDCAATAFAKYRIFREFRVWKYAEQSLLQGLAIVPDSLELRLELVTVFVTLGRSSEALEQIRSALQVPSDNNMALRSLGYSALKLKAEDLAEQCFRRAAALDPEEDPRMLEFLRHMALKRGNYEEAGRYLTWASKLSLGGMRQAFAQSEPGKS